MPKMGESITEGTILKWLKNVGDKIAKDEPILEISTDKVDTEVPSPFSGTLTKQHAKDSSGAVVSSSRLSRFKRMAWLNSWTTICSSSASEVSRGQSAVSNRRSASIQATLRHESGSLLPRCSIAAPSATSRRRRAPG